MTKGAAGSIVKYDGTIYEIPAFKATPADTTGAGDMYAGAFLFGITNGLGAEKSGRLASLASARVVSQIGARLRDNHEELLKMI
jgi:sugar/nucleoside kinase (ribokinase family)